MSFIQSYELKSRYLTSQKTSPTISELADLLAYTKHPTKLPVLARGSARARSAQTRAGLARTWYG